MSCRRVLRPRDSPPRRAGPAGGSSRRVSCRGGSGRSPRSERSSRAMRAGSVGCRRAASVRRRWRRPPARPPRRGRSRRGGRSGLRGRAPTRRGRPARGSLPLHHRPDLHCAAQARRGDARGDLDRPVEVVGLEQVEAAERVLRLRERAVRGQRAAVLDLDGGCRVGRLELLAADGAGLLGDGHVLAHDGVLLVLAEALVLARRVAGKDQQHVLHGFLLGSLKSGRSVDEREGRKSTAPGITSVVRGRSAIVTGAASGIGRAIAARLVTDGVDVLGVDLEPGEDGFAADLTTRDGNRAAVDEALSRFGRLDAVVANAGFQHVDPVADFPEDRWDALLAILLTSPFLLAKYAWPALAESGNGRFIGIASAHGLVASPFKAGYVSAKHGLLGLVKTLALEGADDGICATAVCPGFVRTPLVESQIESQARAHGKPPERVLEDVILEPHAVKRLIEPEEVADVVAFLMGDSGRAFTGVPVTMDLGWTAR